MDQDDPEKWVARERTVELPPAGWYADPGGSGRLRYFNGSTWTDQFSQPPRQMPEGWQSMVYPGQGGPHVGAPAVAVPHPAAPGEPRSGRSAGPRPKLGRTRTVLAVIVLGLTFLLSCASAFDIYAYPVGTPTTATIKQCHTGTRGHQNCTGTWSVGGKPYTGPVITGWVGGGGPKGSSVDVRVHRGSAYTANVESWDAVLLTLLFAVPVVLVILSALSRWRRRTGR
jgi:hypothetical protein